MSKIIWRRSEVELIIANYGTKTTDELMKMLPGRSRKAINRKIEKLREEGRIGMRTKDTVKRAYRQRIRGSGKAEPSGIGRGRGRLPVFVEETLNGYEEELVGGEYDDEYEPEDETEEE